MRNKIDKMEHSVDIALQDPLWAEIKDIEAFARDIILRTLNTADLPEEASAKPLEVSIVFANNDLVQVLNKEYRGKNKPTNVLSFAMLDDHEAIIGGVAPLGDIIFAYETIKAEAIEHKKEFNDHLAHLLIHGCLHLMGYDHIEDDDANIMEATEIRILEAMNIQNPYTQKL